MDNGISRERKGASPDFGVNKSKFALFRVVTSLQFRKIGGKKVIMYAEVP
jgi:hypothetical protein